MKIIRWWSAQKSDIAHDVFEALDTIRACESWQRNRFLDFLRAYHDRRLRGLDPSQYVRPDSELVEQRYVSYNVIKSCVNTVTAKITQSSPLPVALTDNGDFWARAQAKQLSKWIAGLFYSAKVKQATTAAFLDAALFGTGFVQVSPVGGEIRVERVFPGEVWVDEREGLYEKPHTIYREKQFDREALCQLYPGKASLIESAAGPDQKSLRDISGKGSSDQVKVVYAWHTNVGKKTGKHVICVSNCVLEESEYDSTELPFAIIRWDSPVLGFWGVGLAEQLWGIQQDIKELLGVIRESQRLLCVGRFFVREGSVDLNHLTDEIGSVVEFKTEPPQVVTMPGVSPELYQQLETFYRKAFELTGISQLSAQSQKPAGLNSGQALRTYEDISSERFIVVGRAYEQAHVDVATRAIECAKVLADKNPDFEVVYESKSSVERIKWADVKLDESSYVLKVFKASSLPTTPAGRFAALKDWADAGLITPDQMKKLLDAPDLEQEVELMRAPRDVIEQILETMALEQRYISPEPFFDLALGIQLGIQYYSRGLIEAWPESTLELYRRWIASCQALLTPPAPPPPPPGLPVPPIPPPAGPELPPEPLPPPPAGTMNLWTNQHLLNQRPQPNLFTRSQHPHRVNNLTSCVVGSNRRSQN